MSPDDLATLPQTSTYRHWLAPRPHGIMGKSMLLLSGCVVVVGDRAVTSNCSDSEPLSCCGWVAPTQEVFKSGWDVGSAATMFVFKIIWSLRCWQV